MEGTSVFICKFPDDATCLPCGFARDTSLGEWTTVHCTGGMIEGNQVKIVHSFGRLKLCEVEVYGKDLT